MPAGSAAWQAAATATAAGSARQPLGSEAPPPSRPVHSQEATSSKVRVRASSVASRPRYQSLPCWMAVSADSITSSGAPRGSRRRPRRASRSTSSRSNELVRPLAARSLRKSPRLT